MTDTDPAVKDATTATTTTPSIATTPTTPTDPGAAEPRCPRCGTPLVTERRARPWCPACEWDLAGYERDRRRPELGWHWLDRRAYRLAYRLTERQFAALAGRDASRPGWTAARVGLAAGGVVFLAAIAAALAGGIFLIVRYWFGPLTLAGAVLVLLAIGLRPRLGRIDPDADTLTRDRAPALFGLIEEVARAAGAPVPRVVAVDGSFNASCGVVGLRRTPVLTLGLPLWAVLTPQERVALLGHELGHLVNGDSRRGALTGVPVATLARLAAITRPGGTIRRRQRSFGIGLAEMITNLVMGGVHRVLVIGLLATMWVTLRDSQRGEYLADQISARVAGGAAATGLFDTLLLGDGITTVLLAAARRGEQAAGWRAAADRARHDVDADRWGRLRQLSIRDGVSMFASHPPAGLRTRMVESRPAGAPAVLLGDADSAAIDDELAKWYARTRKDLVAT